MSTPRVIRWLLLRLMLALLSFLIVVLPVPITPSVARAENAFNVSTANESFNFSSQSASTDEGAIESAGANALKQRTSPVSTSGAFSTSVSIDVPPGRSGMTPTLGLSYVSDSFRQDSPVGAGWSFGVPSISRDTSEGFPTLATVSNRLRYDDSRALFSGPSGRLVRSTLSEGLKLASGSLLFVPEREHSPVRYEYSPGSDRWVEHLPSGIKRYYGASDLGSTAARNARVKNEVGTHEWLLLKERDADGNTIEYDYHFLDGEYGQARVSVDRAQAVPVLKSVRWGANDAAKIPHAFRVATETRDYEGQLDMLHGHTLLTSQVTAINVYGPWKGAERLVWRYTLDLRESADTFRHLLRGVTRTGFDVNTGAAETPVIKRFSYATNGDASWKTASLTAPGAESRLYSEAQLLPGDSEIYRGGFRLDRETDVNGRPTFDTAPIEELQKLRTMEQLTPDYIGAGYRFEDIDADGDHDVLYNPTGLGTPAARLVLHKSYLKDGGAFRRLRDTKEQDRNTFNGIPGDLLITSLADVDGDSDPDAVSFPLRWADPIAGGSAVSGINLHYSASDTTFDLARFNNAHWTVKGQIISELVSPLSEPGEAACAPSGPAVTVERGGMLLSSMGTLPELPPVPGLRDLTPVLFPGLPFTPPLWPFPPRPPGGGGVTPPDVGTQDPDGNLINGDPMLDIRFRLAKMLGLCRNYPWYMTSGAWPVWRDPVPEPIRVAYNTSRGAAPTGGKLMPDGTRELSVYGWPRHAVKQARWVIQPGFLSGLCAKEGGIHDRPACPLAAPLSCVCTANTRDEDSVNAAWAVLTSDAHKKDVFWRGAFLQSSDFHAPLADVNADGRADIMLLKTMSIFAGGSYTNFSPNAFISTGAGFSPERESSVGIGFDITGLVTLDPDVLNFRRAYLNITRPMLQRLRPGPSLALSPETLDILPAAQRAEVVNIIDAFRAQDPNDDDLMLGLQTAVTNAFDLGVEAVSPAPIVSLRDMATEILRNTVGWFGNWFNFAPSLLPDLRFDLTDMLIPRDDRTYVSLPGMVETLRRTGRSDLLVPVKVLFDVFKPMLGGPLIDGIFRTAAPTSRFTHSALEILNNGRDTFCPIMDSHKTCGRMSTYPINFDFNAFMFDANGDGLPDMVAAHQPILVVPTKVDSKGNDVLDEDGNKIPEYNYYSRNCLAGHEVFLNRGYRWDDPRDAALHTTMPLVQKPWHAASGQPRPEKNTAWSSEIYVTREKAFGLLNQRTKACNEPHFYENAFAAHKGVPPAFAGLPMSAASFSDINADGLSDVVFAAVTKDDLGKPDDPHMIEQYVFLNTGRGFKGVVTPDPNAEAELDSYLRLTGRHPRTTGWLPWRGLPSDFYMTQYIRRYGTTLGTQDRARLVDVDSDGLLDVVYRGECQKVLQIEACSRAIWRRNMRKVPDLLTRIDEGSGAWTEVDYVSANSEAGRAVVGRSLGTPPTGLMVASEIRSGAQPIANVPGSWANVGGASVQRIRLAYDNYSREENGRRALGFAVVAATFAIGLGSSFADVSASTYTYDVTKSVPGTSVSYPRRGSLLSAHSRDLAPTGTGSEQLTTYDYVVSGLGSAARIRSGRVTTKTRSSPLSPWMASASEPSKFDTLGYPTTFVSGRATEAGAVLPSGPETTTTTTVYRHRTAEWRLGREESVTTTGDRVSATGGRTAGTLSKTVTTYDAVGRVASHAVLQDVGSTCSGNRAQSNTTTFPSYSAAGLPYVINDNGTAVTLTYDALHLYAATRSTTVPRTPSSPNGPTLEEGASYDPRFGSVTETSDMNGHTTERAYDSRGRLLTVVGPDESLLEQHSYNDADGGPWTATTKTYTTSTSSFLTWSAFDGDGRVLASNQQVTASAAVRLARNQFDGLGRLVASYPSATLDVPAASSLQNLAIEPNERDALATRTTYDGFDRVLTQTMPDARVVRHAYDNVSVSNVVFARKTTTNPRNLTSVRVFNTRGSLVSMERRNASNAAELSYRYEYDGAGRMVGVIDSLGTRRVSFDEGGRLRSATLPYLSGTPRTHAYCYDARAKLTSATTLQGRKVIVNRDALGRVADLKVAFFRQNNGQPTTSASFTYDCSAAEGSLGKICGRTDDAGSTYIAYDLYGRPNRYETTLDDDIADTLPANIPNWYGVQFDYGLAGQLESTTVEGLGTSAHKVSYAHDLLARTNGITVTDGATTRPLVKAATYDAFGRLKNATLGNNVVSAWDVHLASGHLTAQRMIEGTSTFAELRYPLAEYDPNGNIRREQHLANGELVSEKVHTYDALDQLATSTLSMGGTERKNERFAFSQGNLTSVVGAGRTDTYAYADASNTQAVKTIKGGTPGSASEYSRSITYDTDGWVSRDVEKRPASGDLPATITDRTLAFDAGGCMREAVVREAPANAAARTTTTRNICGFDASRAYRETTFPDAHVERVYYLPDGSELRPDKNLFVMQLPVATSTTATLAWSLDTGAIVHDESGYIHTDMRGSVVARTQLNASNATVPSAKAEYGVWGDTLAYSGAATPRYQFTNEEPDPGTGYYYFGARPYDPTLRRWLAPDALMMRNLAAGAATVVDLNLYAYAGNNPVSRIDKSGFAANCAEGACAPSNTLAPEMIFDLADGAANGAVPHGVTNSTFGHDITWNVGRVLGATAGLVSDLVGAAAAGAAGAAAVVYSGGTAAVAGVGAMAATATATVAVVAGVVKAHAGALSDAVNSIGGSGSKGSADKSGAPAAEKRAPSQIDRNAFKKERETFWKAEAKAHPEKYSKEDLAKMAEGRAPKGSDGHPMELHHVDRTPEGGTTPMTRTDHRLGDNYKKNHPE